MGYYSSFKLSNAKGISPVLIPLATILTSIHQIIGYEVFDPIVFDDQDELDAPEAKWYDHDLHCLELSRWFPNSVFVLEGQGVSETETMWKTYYHNGKCQMCPAIITYDAYSPDKLKTLEEWENEGN